MEQDDDFDFYPDDAVALRKDSQQGPGTTLLPAPIASVVSLVTRSSSLYIRVGTFVGGLFIDGARVTTLTGLELSRAVIEGILSRAGRDVTARSTGELGRAEAESLLEKSIATLHTTITSISFAASTGFYISSTALSTASDVSGQLLSTMDSILGSTDSSRAISSIITLIRREFRNPATGQEGEKVSVADLLLGICSLALLQRWSRKLTDIECKQRNYEHVIWDVVILDNGRRADVIGVDKNGSSTTREGDKHSSRFLTTRGEAEVLETVERDNINEDGSSEDDLPEINLKQRIMKSLPADASVSITTSTSTTTTVTVEITGSQPPDLIPPPGVEIIEENAHHPGPVDLDEMTTNEHNEQNVGFLTPRYRVVYRIMRDRVQGTDFETSEAIEAPEINEVIEVSDQEGPNEAEPKTTRPEMNFPTEAHLASPEAEDEPTSPPQTSSIPVTSPALRSRDMNSVSNSRTSPSSIRSESPSNKGYGTQMLPSTKGQAENLPYSKRARKPMSSSSSISSVDGSGKKAPAAFSRPSLKKIKSEPKLVNKSEKKGAFRNALRKGSTTPLSSLWNKDSSAPEAAISALPNKIIQRPTWGISAPSSVSPKSSVPSNLPIPKRGSTLVPGDTPRAPQRGNPNYFSSRDLEARPCSPTAFRTHLKAQSTMLRARSEKGIAGSPSISPQKNQHRRNVSHAPSIYTLRTNNSATSLILAGQPGKSAFESQETMESLMRTGFVDGLFPQHHIVRNITRFVKFASASYGASFLRVMGITTSTGAQSREFNTEHHHEHHSFSNHTQLPADTILLSSFVDPQGGTDSSGHTNTGVPMVHFVSLDHESKAVVLTCRGTLGFDDVLADMTCDYDEVFWRGRAYKVHKGIYASARRLLSSRVFVTITAALEEFPEYGLVLCGHSLGGGVTALLAILISEPATTGTAFVTTSEYQRPQLMLPSATDSGTASPQIHIPAGRPIHVYAYGPPATFSPSLRLATRGLITTIVNGQDLVPHLSLGVLHDLQAVALALKTDPSGAKGEVRNRLFAGLTSAFADRWYGNRPAGMQGEAEDDKWAYSALKSLRASMLSSKLLPPGEVFVVEASPVLQRHAFVEKGEEGERKGLGRPATRSILKYVRDVEARFGEVRFGGSMLLDHSPGRYEVSLEALRRGVLG